MALSPHHWNGDGKKDFINSERHKRIFLRQKGEKERERGTFLFLVAKDVSIWKRNRVLLFAVYSDHVDRDEDRHFFIRREQKTEPRVKVRWHNQSQNAEQWSISPTNCCKAQVLIFEDVFVFYIVMSVMCLHLFLAIVVSVGLSLLLGGINYVVKVALMLARFIREDAWCLFKDPK